MSDADIEYFDDDEVGGGNGIDVQPSTKQLPTSLHALMQARKLDFESNVESTDTVGSSRNLLELANSSITIFDFDTFDTPSEFPDEICQSPANNGLVEELNQKILQLEADNVTLVEELDALSKAMQCKQESDHELTEVELLRTEIKSLKIDLKEANEKIQRAESARNVLLNKLSHGDSLADEKDTLQHELQVLKSIHEDLREEHKHTKSELSSLQFDALRLQTDAQTKAVEFDKCKADVTRLQAENKELKDRCSRLQNESQQSLGKWELKYTTAENDIKSLEEQLCALQIDITEKSHVESRLRHEISLLEVKTSQLEAENASLRRKNIDFEARDRDASHLQHVVASLEREIQTLASENNHLRQTVNMELRSHREPYIHPKYEPRPVPSQRHEPVAAELRRVSRNIDYTDASSHVSLRDGSTLHHTSSHVPASSHRNNSENHYTERTHSTPPIRTSADLSSGQPKGAKSLASMIGKRHNTSSQSTPFATDLTTAEMKSFEALERQLTELMTEKTSLEEELSRLHQRGGKTLRERTRTTQVESRLEVLGKEIAASRRDLSQKPA